MMVSRLIEGVIVFQVRTVGTFRLTGTAKIFPVNLGAGISHRIGGVGISRHEVVVIYRPSNHALIFHQVGHRDMVDICRLIIILVGIFRLTRRAIIDSLATSTNRRLAVIGWSLRQIAARASLKGIFLTETGRHLGRAGDIPRENLSHSLRDGWRLIQIVCRNGLIS